MPPATRNRLLLTGLVLLLTRCAFAVSWVAPWPMSISRQLPSASAPSSLIFPAFAHTAGHMQLHILSSTQCNVRRELY